MKALLLISVLLTLGSMISPENVLAKGAVVGEGAFTCERYSSRSDYKKNDFIIWLQGYFTAYNAMAPDTSNIAGDRDYYWIRQWLDNYCKSHPTEYFNDAVVALTQELHSHQKP